jgi:hypothetical protein
MNISDQNIINQILNEASKYKCKFNISINDNEVTLPEVTQSNIEPIKNIVKQEELVQKEIRGKKIEKNTPSKIKVESQDNKETNNTIVEEKKSEEKKDNFMSIQIKSEVNDENIIVNNKVEENNNTFVEQRKPDEINEEYMLNQIKSEVNDENIIVNDKVEETNLIKEEEQNEERNTQTNFIKEEEDEKEENKLEDVREVTIENIPEEINMDKLKEIFFIFGDITSIELLKQEVR